MYSWSTLSYLLDSVLKHTSDRNVTDRIFAIIKKLKAELIKAKEQV